MTSFARSSRSFLEARDSRQDALTQALSQGHPATLFVSLNIPGQDKTPPGAEAFFLWVSGRLAAVFPDAVRLVAACDALGPYSILGLSGNPGAIKAHCIRLETEHPASRLIDLDVYDSNGAQIDRASLDLPGRICLVCEQRAVDCIRARRHDYAEIIAKVHELLAPFRT